MSRRFVTPTKAGAKIRLGVSPGACRTSIAGALGENTVRFGVAASDVCVVSGIELEEVCEIQSEHPS